MNYIKKYWIVVLIILTLGLTQCQKIEKIENAGAISPRLIVNCVAEEGESFIFTINKSLSALDNAPMRTFKNAKIVLYAPGGISETITYDPTYEVYFSKTMFAEYGKTYSIKVSAPGLETVFSEMVMPNPVQITKSELKLIGLTSNQSGGSTYYSKYFDNGILKISLDDEPGKSNYYMLQLTSKWEGKTIYRGSNHYWVSNYPDIESVYSSNGSGQSFFFDDGLFDGKEIQLELKTAYKYNFYGSNTDSLVGYDITLYKLTEDLSRHWITVLKSRENEENPFQDPVQIYSNIKGGYGVFAGKSQLEKFVPVR